jgi:hypothetical protein
MIPIYNGPTLSRDMINFIQDNHYSRSARSLLQKHVFTLMSGNKILGIAVYGQPISRNSPKSSLELRRFCLAPGAEKNTASNFLAFTLRWLRQNEPSYTEVLTFADPNQGHRGTIYKACNFLYDGLEENNPRVVMIGDKVVHIRQYYQKKDGQYSNDALKYQKLVAEGKGKIVPQQRKLRFIYKLR